MELIFRGLSIRTVAFLFCVLSIMAVALFVPLKGHAQGQAGISISPAIIDESDKPVTPGTEYEYSVTVENLTDNEQVFYLSTKDIVDVANGGAPVFADGTEEKTGLELANWIVLPATEIRIGSNASERITFKVKVPNEATPGSHFGSIFISAVPPEVKQVGAAVGYDVANIIILRVAGDVTDSANIRQFSTKRYFNASKNIDFSVRIENTGNVLVKPIGPVKIYNMLGKKVDMITFNESQASVFPKRVRQYEFNWSGEGTGFGRYEAVISPVYGESGAKKTMSSTVSFWILPMNIIIPALAGLAFLLLITFIFVKLYIRRTLAHLAHGQTRIVRRRKQNSLSSTLLLVVVMLTVSAAFLILLLILFA